MTQYAVKYEDQLVEDHSWVCVADVVATYLSGAFSEGGRVTGVLVSREADGDEWVEVPVD